MKCPKCGGKHQVLRSYSVDAIGTTQDRHCDDCGYRSTTVVMELREHMSAYKARELLKAQHLQLVRTYANEAETEG